MLKAYHVAGDTQRILFLGYEGSNSKEKFEEVLDFLKNFSVQPSNLSGGEKYIFFNQIDDARFGIVQPYGRGDAFLYCENEKAVLYLEELFNAFADKSNNLPNEDKGEDIA